MARNLEADVAPDKATLQTFWFLFYMFHYSYLVIIHNTEAFSQQVVQYHPVTFCFAEISRTHEDCPF